MKLPPGYTSRPATPDDLDEVAALLEAWELAHFGETDAVRSEVQFEWGAAWFDIERDTRLIRNADGELAAYAEHATPDPAHRFEVFGPVHPRFEGHGLGSAILDWAEEQTRSRLQAGSVTRLWNSAPAGDAGAIRLLEVYGYEPIRTFRQLTIDLDVSFDAGPVPDGVTIRPFVAAEDGPAAFAAVDAAFATHFGYWEETFEEWWAQQQADETWDPTLGLVAELDGTIVGVSNNGVIDGTGHVYELGVVPERQGRGIGRALLRHSLAMFAARGIRTGRLGVDTRNVTGAAELYRSVGMVPVREQRVFEKRLEVD
ncbi:MAG: N-acetyltransferase family protein [Actinomycetota bacterium]